LYNSQYSAFTGTYRTHYTHYHYTKLPLHYYYTTTTLPLRYHCTAGGHLNITEVFDSLDEHVQRLQPDPSQCATPPLEPWLDGLVPSSVGGVGGSNSSQNGSRKSSSKPPGAVGAGGAGDGGGGGGEANPYGPGSAFSIPANEDEFEEILRSNKAFTEVGAAHQQIVDMLTEDCSHLLRKAAAKLAPPSA
jgi:hypothetical protein